MNLELLKTELINENFLREIIYFDELESTNAYAKKNNTAEDTLVVTSNQFNGKGRFNRQWNSLPFKDLTFSLVKSFKIRIDESHLVNFYSSYILFQTLTELSGGNESNNFSLKWPNDILLNGKKIAGFLLDVKDFQSDFKKFVIGVGLNVNSIDFPEELKLKATSIFNETKHEIKPENILIRFVKNYYGNLFLIGDKNELMKKWISNTSVIGKRIKFRNAIDAAEKTATVVNIDTDGGIMMKFNNEKTEKYYSGEISLDIG